MDSDQLTKVDKIASVVTYRYGVPYADIEDMKQHITMRLLEFIERNGIPDNLEALVYTIGRRETGQFHRRKGVREKYSHFLKSEYDSLDDPMAVYQASQMHEHIKQVSYLFDFPVD